LRRNKVKALQRRLEYRIFAKHFCRKCKNYTRWQCFSRVVATGSLSSAARELGLSPALVSRRIAALEARLGVRLLHRTTRSLRLTDEGASYLDTCSRVLAEIAEADAAVGAGRVEPQGALKSRHPGVLRQPAHRAADPAFAARYPKCSSR